MVGELTTPFYIDWELPDPGPARGTSKAVGCSSLAPAQGLAQGSNVNIDALEAMDGVG